MVLRFLRRPSQTYTLRRHRARSVLVTDAELVELSLVVVSRPYYYGDCIGGIHPILLSLVQIRASQRTFEGAYMRTALGQFSFALVVLKIFTAEFYSIGALFAAYGAGLFLISLYRRHQGNQQFFEIIGEDGLQRKRFKTSGNVVIILTALSICAYAALLALVLVI